MLVRRYSRYVYAICTQAYRLSDTDADDVFQDVFAKTYQHLGRLRDDAAIRPWIGQVTRRAALDRIRSHSREEVVETIEDSGEEDAAFARLDDAMTVRSALTRLSEPCQEVLDRFFARDESYDKISQVLGIPAGTIASRISRCLVKLRGVLEAPG